MKINLSVYLSIHPGLDYLCTSVFPLGQAHSTDFICQLPYSSLRFMGWYKHCNEWYYSFWTVPQLNGNTTAFFPVGICFTCLQWKVVCASASPWEAAGLGCRFLEQKAPHFLLSLAVRWDKVATMGSHTLVYFVSLTEVMTENSRAICNIQLEYFKGIKQSFGKKEGKGFQSFLLLPWHGGCPACAWGDTSAWIDCCRGLSGLRSLLWASFCGLNQSGNFQYRSPKWGVSSRKASGLTEKEEGDADCQDFTQLNRACSQERLFEQEACVALNKTFIRCCNSSLQLLQSYFRLSSALTVDHSVRK